MESQDVKQDDPDGMPLIIEGDYSEYSYYDLFKPIKQLGAGAYGNVYLCVTKNGKKKVAIKVVDIENKTQTDEEVKYCK